MATQPIEADKKISRKTFLVMVFSALLSLIAVPIFRKKEGVYSENTYGGN